MPGKRRKPPTRSSSAQEETVDVADAEVGFLSGPTEQAA
jgi:hypothetical protein